jgi:hypothetical protein
MPIDSLFPKIVFMIDGRKLALVASLVALVGIAGCGNGSGEDPGSTVAAAQQERIYPNVHGPTREFLIRDGDNVVQMFGTEGTPAQRRAVTTLLRGWMRARAAAAWSKDCSYLHRGFIHELVIDAHHVSGGKVHNCPQALAFFGHEASGNLKNTFAGQKVVSLRLQGVRGYAQYHGNEGRHDWVVPVRREGAQWKVMIASPLGRSS